MIKKMNMHLFFPFTLPDWPLPPAPAIILLFFKPFKPFKPPFPVFFAPSLPPSGDAAFDQRLLWVFHPWDLVDDGVVGWGCGCGGCGCGGCASCSLSDDDVVVKEDGYRKQLEAIITCLGDVAREQNPRYLFVQFP
jgi:hypothetical protein